MINIYDEEDKTIYSFYLDGKLYAWTSNKKDRDMFEQQRNMKIFKRKKRILEPIVFHAFMQKYKLYQIIDIPVCSNGEDIYIFGTYYEDNQLSQASDDLIIEFEKSKDYFELMKRNTMIPDKYYKAAKLLYSCFTMNKKTKCQEFQLDSLGLFYQLFKNTF